MNVASITAIATSHGLEATGLETVALEAGGLDAPAVELIPAGCALIASFALNYDFRIKLSEIEPVKMPRTAAKFQ
jgi:hypothetical protein